MNLPLASSIALSFPKGVNIYSKRVDSVYETLKETLFGFQGVKSNTRGDASGGRKTVSQVYEECGKESMGY